MSKRLPDPRRVDVAAACADGLALAGEWALDQFDRLAEGGAAAVRGAPVAWNARFERRPAPGCAPERWLRLQVTAQVRRECQRCLQPVMLPLSVDRWLRFADDEATAAALDADSDEDVLVASRQFDLRNLVEDELLLALPLVPMHEACPEPLPAAQAQAVDDDVRASPFAALAALKRDRTH
jgi:uncharacterized protein